MLSRNHTCPWRSSSARLRSVMSRWQPSIRSGLPSLVAPQLATHVEPAPRAVAVAHAVLARVLRLVAVEKRLQVLLVTARDRRDGRAWPTRPDPTRARGPRSRAAACTRARTSPCWWRCSSPRGRRWMPSPPGAAARTPRGDCGTPGDVVTASARRRPISRNSSTSGAVQTRACEHWCSPNDQGWPTRGMERHAHHGSDAEPRRKGVGHRRRRRQAEGDGAIGFAHPADPRTRCRGPSAFPVRPCRRLDTRARVRSIIARHDGASGSQG